MLQIKATELEPWHTGPLMSAPSMTFTLMLGADIIAWASATLPKYLSWVG